MVLNVEGSSPFSHPKKSLIIYGLLRIFFFLSRNKLIRPARRFFSFCETDLLKYHNDFLSLSLFCFHTIKNKKSPANLNDLRDPRINRTQDTFRHPSISCGQQGRCTQDLLPTPISESTPMIPPILSTIDLHIDNPKPVPCAKESSFSNRSKIVELIFRYSTPCVSYTQFQLLFIYLIRYIYYILCLYISWH